MGSLICNSLQGNRPRLLAAQVLVVRPANAIVLRARSGCQIPTKQGLWWIGIPAENRLPPTLPEAARQKTAPRSSAYINIMCQGTHCGFRDT